MIKVPKTGTRDKKTQESLFLWNAQGWFHGGKSSSMIERVTFWFIEVDVCSRLPNSIISETETFFINLCKSRLSIVVQIYTSVLKTKVKLIEYAFETLPACG